MNLRPVIAREMLVEARHPATMWTRLGIGSVGLVAFLAIAALGRFDHTTGARLFHQLNILYFVIIWCLTPLLTADSLSQERRENTLGLLFLAGLNGRDIVLGKSCAHSLRALNLLWSMLPFQILPVVLGGVTWAEIVFVNVVNFASILLTLAAGMLASAVSRSWWRALPLALLLAAGFLVFFTAAMLLVNPAAHRSPALGAAALMAPVAVDSAAVGWLAAPWTERVRLQFLSLFELQRQLSGAMGGTGLFASTPPEIIFTVAASTLLAVALAWLCLGVASRMISASWMQRPASGRTLRWRQFWSTPRFLRSLLQQRLAGAMRRNPVGWLHQRSWRARCLKWGWFLAVAIVTSQILRESVVSFWRVPATLRLVAVIMLLGLAFTAASAFRQERESGSFELLLVSPLSDTLIFAGRVRGVLSQYGPALGLLAFVWVAVYLDLPGVYSRLQDMFFWAEPFLLWSSAISLTVIGVSQSLHRRTALWSSLITLSLGLLIPFAAAGGLNLLASAVLMAGRPPVFDGSFVWVGTFIGAQLLITFGCGIAALTTLANREAFARFA